MFCQIPTALRAKFIYAVFRLCTTYLKINFNVDKALCSTYLKEINDQVCIIMQTMEVNLQITSFLLLFKEIIVIFAMFECVR